MAGYAACVAYYLLTGVAGLVTGVLLHRPARRAP